MELRVLVFGVSLFVLSNGQVINTQSSDKGHVTIPLKSTGHLSSLKPFQTVVKDLNSAFTQFYDIQVQSKLSPHVSSDMSNSSTQSVGKNVTSDAVKQDTRTETAKVSSSRNGVLKMNRVISTKLDLLKPTGINELKSKSGIQKFDLSNQGNLNIGEQNMGVMPLSSVAIKPIDTSTNGIFASNNVLAADRGSSLKSGSVNGRVNLGTFKQQGYSDVAMPSSPVSVEPVNSPAFHDSFLSKVDVSPSLKSTSNAPGDKSLSHTATEPRLNNIPVSEVTDYKPGVTSNQSRVVRHNEGTGMASVRVERTVNQNSNTMDSTNSGDAKAERILNMLHKNRQNINSKSGIKIEIGTANSNIAQKSSLQNSKNTIGRISLGIASAPIQNVKSIVSPNKLDTINKLNNMGNTEPINQGININIDVNLPAQKQLPASTHSEKTVSNTNNKLTEKSSLPDPWSKIKTLPFTSSVGSKIEKTKSLSSAFNVPQMFISGNSLANRMGNNAESGHSNTLIGVQENTLKSKKSKTYHNTEATALMGVQANTMAATKGNTLTEIKSVLTFTTPLHGKQNKEAVANTATERKLKTPHNIHQTNGIEPQYIESPPHIEVNIKNPTNVIARAQQPKQQASYSTNVPPPSRNMVLSQSPASYYAMADTMSSNSDHSKMAVSGIPTLSNTVDIGSVSSQSTFTNPDTTNKRQIKETSFSTNILPETSALKNMPPKHSILAAKNKVSSNTYKNKQKSQLSTDPGTTNRYNQIDTHFRNTASSWSVMPSVHPGRMANDPMPKEGMKQANLNTFQQPSSPGGHEAISSTKLSKKGFKSHVSALGNSGSSTLMKSNELNANNGILGRSDYGNQEPVLQRIKHAIPETRIHNSAQNVVQNGKSTSNKHSMKPHTMNRLSKSILTSNPKLLQEFPNSQRVPEHAAGFPNQNNSFKTGLPWIDPPITVSNYDTINTTFYRPTLNNSVPQEISATGLSVDRPVKQWSELATNFNSIPSVDLASVQTEVHIVNNQTLPIENVPPPPEKSLLVTNKKKRNRDRWLSPKELLPNLWSSEIISLHVDAVKEIQNGTATKLDKIGITSIKNSNSTINSTSTLEGKMKKKEKKIAEAIAAVAAKADWMSSPTISPRSRKKGPWYEPTLANNEIKPVKMVKEKQNDILQVPPEPSIQIVESSSDFFASWDPWNAPQKTKAKQTPDVKKAANTLTKWKEPSGIKTSNSSPKTSTTSQWTEPSGIKTSNSSPKTSTTSQWIEPSGIKTSNSSPKTSTTSQWTEPSGIKTSNSSPKTGTISQQNIPIKKLFNSGSHFGAKSQKVIKSKASNALSTSNEKLINTGRKTTMKATVLQQNSVPISQTIVSQPQNTIPLQQNDVLKPQNVVSSSQTGVPINQNVVPSTQTDLLIQQSTIPLQQTDIPIPDNIVPSSQTGVQIQQNRVPSTQTDLFIQQNTISSRQTGVSIPQNIIQSHSVIKSPRKNSQSPQNNVLIPHNSVSSLQNGIQAQPISVSSSQSNVPSEMLDITSVQSGSQMPQYRDPLGVPISEISISSQRQQSVPRPRNDVQISQNMVQAERNNILSTQNTVQLPQQYASNSQSAGTHHNIKTSPDTISLNTKEALTSSKMIQSGSKQSPASPLSSKSLPSVVPVTNELQPSPEVPQIITKSSYMNELSTGQHSAAIPQEAYPKVSDIQNVNSKTHNANPNYVVSSPSISNPSQLSNLDLIMDRNILSQENQMTNVVSPIQSPAMSTVMNGNLKINLKSSSSTLQSLPSDLPSTADQIPSVINDVSITHQKTPADILNARGNHASDMNTFQQNHNDMLLRTNEVSQSTGIGHVDVIPAETTPNMVEITHKNKHVDPHISTEALNALQPTGGYNPQVTQPRNIIIRGPHQYDQTPTISEIVNPNSNAYMNAASSNIFPPGVNDVTTSADHRNTPVGNAETVPQQQSSTILEVANQPPDVYTEPIIPTGIPQQTDIQSSSSLSSRDPHISSIQSPDVYIDISQPGFTMESASLPESLTQAEAVNVDPNLYTNHLISSSNNNAYQPTSDMVIPSTNIENTFSQSSFDKSNANPTGHTSSLPSNTIQSSTKELPTEKNQHVSKSVIKNAPHQDAFPVKSMVASNQVGPPPVSSLNKPIHTASLQSAAILPNEQSPHVFDNAYVDPSSSTSSLNTLKTSHMDTGNNPQIDVYSGNIAETIPKNKPLSLSEFVQGNSNTFKPFSESSSSPNSLLENAKDLSSAPNQITPSRNKAIVVNQIPNKQSPSISEIANRQPTIYTDGASSSSSNTYTPTHTGGKHQESLFEIISKKSNTNNIASPSPNTVNPTGIKLSINIGTHSTGADSVPVSVEQYQPVTEIVDTYSPPYQISDLPSSNNNILQSSDLPTGTSDIRPTNIVENVNGKSHSPGLSSNALDPSASDLFTVNNEIPPSLNVFDTAQTPKISEIIEVSNIHSDPTSSSSWHAVAGGEQQQSNRLDQTLYDPGAKPQNLPQTVSEIVNSHQHPEPILSATDTLQSIDNNLLNGANQMLPSENAQTPSLPQEASLNQNLYQTIATSSNGNTGYTAGFEGEIQSHQSSNVANGAMIPQGQSPYTPESTNTMPYQDPSILQAVNDITIGASQSPQINGNADASALPQEKFSAISEYQPKANLITNEAPPSSQGIQPNVEAKGVIPTGITSDINQYVQPTDLNTPISDLQTPSEVMNVDHQTSNALDLSALNEPQSNYIPAQSANEISQSKADVSNPSSSIKSEVHGISNVQSNPLPVSSQNEKQHVATDMLRETIQVNPTKERTATEANPKEQPITTLEQNTESQVVSSLEGINPVSTHNLRSQYDIQNKHLKSELAIPGYEGMQQTNEILQNDLLPKEPIKIDNAKSTAATKTAGGAELANKFAYLSDLLSNGGRPIAKEVPREKPVYETFADLNIAKMMDTKFDPLQTMVQSSNVSEIGAGTELRHNTKGTKPLTMSERVSRIMNVLSSKSTSSSREANNNNNNNFRNLNTKDSAKILTPQAFGTQQRLVGQQQSKLGLSSILNSLSTTQHDLKMKADVAEKVNQIDLLKQAGLGDLINKNLMNSITGTAELPVSIMSPKGISSLTSSKQNPSHSKPLATNNSIFFDPHTFEAINPFAKVTKETIDKAGKVWLDALSSASSKSSRLWSGILPSGFHGISSKGMNTERVYSDISIIDPVTNGELLRINVPESKRKPSTLPKLGYDPNIQSAPDSIFLPVMFGPIDNPQGKDIEISGPMLAVQVGNGKSPRLKVLSPVENLRNNNDFHSKSSIMSQTKTHSKPLDTLSVVTKQQNPGRLFLKPSNHVSNIFSKSHIDMSLPVQHIYTNLDQTKSNSHKFLANRRFIGKIRTQPSAGTNRAFQMPQQRININSKAAVKPTPNIRNQKKSVRYTNDKPLVLSNVLARQIAPQSRVKPVTTNNYLQRIPQTLSVYNRPWKYSSLPSVPAGGSQVMSPSVFPYIPLFNNYPRLIRIRPT